MQAIFNVTTESEMIRLGELLGARLQPGNLLFLFGDLGAGKTTLTKGIAQGLGIVEPITSPTFQLVKTYSGRYTLNHLDLYRLEEPDELKVLDPASLVEEGVTVVEWGELLLKWLQPEYLEVIIHLQPGQHCRQVIFRAQGEIYERVIEGIKDADIRN